MLLLFSLLLAIIGNTLYHLCQKLVPSGLPPLQAVAIMYAVGFLAAFSLSLIVPGEYSWSDTPKKLSWSVLGVGCAAFMIELGVLLAYRFGAKLSNASLMITVATTSVLLPIGILFFQESLTSRQQLGIIVALVGLVLLG